MIDTDLDLLREEVKTEFISQEGKYDWTNKDTNVRIVQDIRKAIDGVADGVIPSAKHIAEVAIATNDNLQIRDFIMGVQLEKNIDYVGEYLALLGNVIDKDKAVPIATIFCGYLYQIKEKEQAKTFIVDILKLNPDYALANILLRVFDAEWPPESFKAMAEQLHNNVINNIYETENQEIENDNN